MGRMAAGGGTNTVGSADTNRADDPSGTSAESEKLRALCEEYWLPVYRVVFQSCRSKLEAEELTQEAFARAIRIHEQTPSGAYVIQVARNLVIDRWRTRRRRPRVGQIDEDLPSEQLGPEALAEAKEQRQGILAALDALPDRYSEVLRLRLQEGLSPLQVGVLMKLSPNAVRQLQFRAIKALRMQLGISKEGTSWLS
jgi:RNA polymerase sigma-70 factor, ECF subfamily